MPSEILERIHEQVAYYERTHPLEDPAERREREFEQRKREAQKAHEARLTREAETASANWYAAVDTRIRTHFKDWAWAAIDERIQQHLEPLKDATGDVLGAIGRKVCDQPAGNVFDNSGWFSSPFAPMAPLAISLSLPSASTA